ncbi:hypothetical protein CDV31_016072 [Fusarium ambrosium]|uniref:Uncharacterized protein n=1 Tax=Fusarium ambrosium TaxID=131363 RepID=A0A428SEZ1_9HYPO|nr:hypothetical protein CDV31_016072 [Fusarium ambrosium]
MANSKKQRPSLFCEWVVGTTIESALGPIPKKPKKPKKRDVVRVEVTTDDESEEDTIKITYPRTGRSTPPPPTEEARTIIKKVRFEDTPTKSALKKPTPVESSDEASDSGPEPESESSQSDNVSSSDASDSDVENSDIAPSPKKKKKSKKKQKPVPDDAESDWDSDPDPTYSTPPSTETPDSEPEEPPKPKNKECGKDKKAGKKAKEPEPETDTSESAEETSESESETPPKKQQPKKEQPKKQGKKKNTKVEESSGGETSESEAESPKPKKKKQGSPKSDAKEDETPEESETDAEASDSANEADAESEPEPEPKKKQKQKNKGKEKAKADSPKGEDEKKEAKQEQKANKQKNKGKQKAEKQPKKAPDQPEDKAEDEKAVEASNQENQGKYKKAKGKRTKEGDKENAAPKVMALKDSRHQNGFFWGNHPQGMLFPHPRRPQLIEPIRAQVVQMERVIRAPSDPVPNAYYDPENNVMRQYQGPPTGNNHGHLYPAHNAFSGPPPTGMPPVPQTPFYYGFNQPQHQPGYGPYPPYNQYWQPMSPMEGYAHVPITRGMPGHAWTAMNGPPGFPPALPAGYGQANPQAVEGKENAALPPSNDKDKTSQNNVGPPGLTGQNNPYLPQRTGSVFKSYGSHGARTASKGDGSARTGSNNWNNVTTWNDGNGDNQQNGQTDWNPVPDNSQNGSGQNDNTWGQIENQNQDQNGNGNNGWDTNGEQQEDNNQKWASRSNGSNGTVRKRRDDHWGNDTHLGTTAGVWEEVKETVPSTSGPAADNNVLGWDVVGDRVAEVSPDSRKSDKGKDEEKPDNVMPGSWVDTPGVAAWGDASAAVDTHGAIW